MWHLFHNFSKLWQYLYNIVQNENLTTPIIYLNGKSLCCNKWTIIHILQPDFLPFNYAPAQLHLFQVFQLILLIDSKFFFMQEKLTA